MRYIKSMHWNNIDPSMLAAQRRAIEALGYSVEQCDATGTPHGAWMDRVMESLHPDDVVLFIDIDCVPMTPMVIERAFASADNGRIFGAAQTANYLPDKDFIYAGPMFLCIAATTWEKLERPSLTSDSDHDAGMRLSKRALSSGVNIDLIMPSFVCRPRWPLGGKGCFGTGTFYDGEVFHLFESRGNKGFSEAFEYVADCVARHRRVDYVALHARMNSVQMELKVARARIAKDIRRIFRR